MLTGSTEAQGASSHLCQASGQKAGRSLQSQAGRKQSTSQNPCSEKESGKGLSLPYAQQCFELYPILFKVRKYAEGPVLLAVVWGTLSSLIYWPL